MQHVITITLTNTVNCDLSEMDIVEIKFLSDESINNKINWINNELRIFAF